MSDAQNTIDTGDGINPGQTGSTSSSNVQTSGSTFVAGGAGPSLPAVSVPSGGGALRSMEEAFDLDLVTGTASLKYQVPVSNISRWGTPNLQLLYSSGGGLSSYGIGWTLAGLASITRSTKLGLPTYLDEQDIYEYNGDELVPVFDDEWTDTAKVMEQSYNGYSIRQYKLRVDKSYIRIERWTRDSTDVHWRVLAGDGTTQLFGYDAASRTACDDRIYAWHYSQAYDNYGNAQLVQYKVEDGMNVDISAINERNRNSKTRQTRRYPKRVLYGNKTPNRTTEWLVTLPSDLPEDDWLFELVFDYGEHDKLNPKPQEDVSWPVRKDACSTYKPGFEVRNYRLCRRFLMFHHFAELKQQNYLVSSFDLEFTENESLTYLASISFVGYKAGKSGGYISKRLPRTEFSYSQAPNEDQLRGLSLQSFDSLQGLLTDQLDWMDLFGDGTTGVLTKNNDTWYYKRNLSTTAPNPDGSIEVIVKLSDAEEIGSRPSPGNNSDRVKMSFQDLDGDGATDLVVTSKEGLNGFFSGIKQVGNKSAVWETFQPFSQWPNLDISDPNLRHIDLTGTGRSDILVTLDDVLVWHESLGQEGYGPEQRVPLVLDDERGPRILFADATESIYLADMSGDGMVDIVRILNSEVCYWPNMGRGRFGTKVTMDNAPVFDHEDSFNPRRILLGDVDGSGTTDLLYFGPSGASLYYNQSGNSWTSALQLPALVPRFDSVTKISAVNLLGTGMCLIWQAPGTNASDSIQYIDFTHGVKPHLLTSYLNNKGSETILAYQTSTSYYLLDDQEGRPWLTTIPTPVHCIDKVIKHDYISKTRVSQHLRYHHGYYDGTERAFSGFGMVEKWDTEEFDVLTYTAKDKDIANVDRATYVPPIYSKTWFHVGALDDVNALRVAYAKEFSTSDHNLADNFTCVNSKYDYTDEELRQATYALRGSKLREEIYADKSQLPYMVGEYSNTILLTQPQHSNVFISCQLYQNESLQSEFDENPMDVRTAQNIRLLLDEYGNTLKQVNITYGRDIDLTDEDSQRQKQTRLIYSEADYTNAIDELIAYQRPQQCSGRTYELTGLSSNAKIYHYADFAGNGDFSPIGNLTDLEYFQDGVKFASFGGITATAPSNGKRLVSSSRRFFRSDDQSGRLSLGQIQPLSIVDQEYALCLTPSMLSAYIRDGENLLPNNVFSDLGYIDLDNNGSWWVPSNKTFFSSSSSPSSSSSEDELIAARSSFFQTTKLVDVHGNSTAVIYDTYFLLPIKWTNAYGNQESSLTIDYRTLSAASIIDSNDNRTDYAYDAVNNLVGTAIVGKEKGVLDSLNGFNPDLSQDELDAFFRSPRAQSATILGSATHCHIYDSNQYVNHQQPAYSATIQRENYGGDLAKSVQISISYTNGSGQEVQTKSVAENNSWRVSGWQVLNNKGNPVENYTPLFSKQHIFEIAAKSNSCQLIFYDTRSRQIATLYPDHTWTKIGYSNWCTTFWSQNNLVDTSPAQDPDLKTALQWLDQDAYSPTWYENRTRQDATPEQKGSAQKALAHKGKSLKLYGDAQGQVILRVSELDAGHLVKERTYFNSQLYSIVEQDASGRIAQQSIYNMLGKVMVSANIDKGWTWTLSDAIASDVYTWSSTSRFRQEYDKLSRPTKNYCQKGANTEICVSKFEYGEILDITTAKTKNLLGKSYKIYDQSGVRTNQEYNVTGQCISSQQQLAVEYKLDIDWSTDIQLESDVYPKTNTFDALGRLTLLQSPKNTQTQYTYNEGGFLYEILGKVDPNDDEWTEYVETTLYDEQGRIVSQATHNDVVSLYRYDPFTHKLSQKTVENGDADLEMVDYIYDASGNLVYQVDHLNPVVYFRNARVTAGSEYTYDNLDRLIQATGREHIGQTRGQPFSSSLGTATPITGQTAAATDGSALARYTESYNFDDCGNILQIRHSIEDAQSPGWTRRLTYTEPSKIEPSKSGNGLSSSEVGNVTENFKYDEHGNTLSMPNVSSATWDIYDRLKSTVTQIVRNGVPETTYYIYDITGTRVRKVVERASEDDASATKSSQTYYLDGTDHIQKFDGQGNVSLECWTSKIGSDGVVCVLLEQWSGPLQSSKGLPSLLIRYQYQSLIKSVFVEVDDKGNILSYEEYTPFGSTTYRANIVDAPKRYRFAGKERDHETGFYYNEQRYYLPWLCRWLNPDPDGVIDGLNLYAYVNGNPVTYRDPNGTCGSDNEEDDIEEEDEGYEGNEEEEEEEEDDRRGGKRQRESDEEPEDEGYYSDGESTSTRSRAKVRRIAQEEDEDEIQEEEEEEEEEEDEDESSSSDGLTDTQRNFLIGSSALAHRVTYDAAHLIPQAFSRKTNLNDLFSDETAANQKQHWVIRVASNIHQDRLKPNDKRWFDWMKMDSGDTDRPRSVRRAIRIAAASDDAALRTKWKNIIAAKMEEINGAVIPWADIMEYKVLYSTSQNLKPMPKYSEEHTYRPYDPTFTNRRTGQQGGPR